MNRNVSILNGEGIIPKEIEILGVDMDMSSNKLIFDDSFIECENLVSVKIPDNITEIGWQAFAYCTNLISVEIPYSVQEIGIEAFAHCDRLESIIIPGSVKIVRQNAFSHCRKLRHVSVSKNTEIFDKAFEWCDDNVLTIVRRPDC